MIQEIYVHIVIPVFLEDLGRILDNLIGRVPKFFHYFVAKSLFTPPFTRASSFVSMLRIERVECLLWWAFLGRSNIVWW